MKSIYDVVVIGSGFGGAITASRLAEAGRSVCILERGKRWKKTDFPRSPGEVARAFWRRDEGSGPQDYRIESFGFLEYKVFQHMDVIQGCGVGGGSLHYFNVHLRTPAPIFSSSRWPLRKLLTAHPLGGCAVGESKESSVVRHQGEVWDYPNLFVSDGSVIPTALAVNPSLTIGALAERTAQWMIHGREIEKGVSGVRRCLQNDKPLRGEDNHERDHSSIGQV